MTRDLAAAAAELADAAGARLMELRRQLTAEAVGSAEMKRRGDEAAQAVLSAELERRFPGDAVLSEEAADDRARLSADRVWIIDPLDGTREYSEAGRDDWAVHVAVWERGDLVAGAVALPARGVVYASHEVSPPPEPPANALRLAVSRTRPPEFVVDLAQRLGGSLVPMGSAGVKAMAVVDGTCDAYVHGGGQYEWDSAAPVAVARAAGLHTSRISGEALAYNNANPWLPDLVVCRPEFADRLVAAIAAAS